MNGIASVQEQRDGGLRILCTVCHKKLKLNCKFDSKQRFLSLAAACDQLAFADEASIYRKLIADLASSGISAEL